MNSRYLIRVAALAMITTVATTAAFAASEAPTAPVPTTAVVPAKTAITKEQAIEMALKAHPGEVTKAYEDGHKGKETWEVKIKGKDGKNWKTYYEISTGTLVDDKEDK